VRRSVLPSGVRILSEQVPGARSATIGYWVAVGSRDETPHTFGSTHFLEHLLFKGTKTRTALDIAVSFDEVGGEHNALTAKEYTCYYAKVQDRDLPMAVDVLSDMITSSLIDADEFETERGVILEELAMADDDPSDVTSERFFEAVLGEHPLGRPILGTAQSVAALDQATLRRYFSTTYVASNFVVVAVGNLDHDRVQALLERALASIPHNGPDAEQSPPIVASSVQIRKKELEQSHVVFGTAALPQHHPERYAGYALNTTLGGSMSSRLFQNVREKRGLAYAVYSGLSAYQDAGALSIYAGCANEAVAELIDVVIAEIRQMKAGGLDAVELRRAKDHLKGSIMLGLESTSSRISHLARQEMYRDRTVGLDEMLASIERVTAADVLRLADRFFTNGSLAVTVLGNVNGLTVTNEQLAL